MKKCIAVVLLVCVFLMSFSLVAFAEINANVVCEGITENGDISFLLVFSDCEGFSSGDLVIRATSSKLSFYTATKGSSVNKGNSATIMTNFSSSAMGRVSFYFLKKISAQNGDNVKSFSAMRLLFTPNENAKGEISISLDGSTVNVGGTLVKIGGTFTFNLNDIKKIPSDESTSGAVKKLLGDTDLNGIVNAADARLALRAAVGLETLSATQIVAADMNLDGIITASDARSILRKSVGLS